MPLMRNICVYDSIGFVGGMCARCLIAFCVCLVEFLLAGLLACLSFVEWCPSLDVLSGRHAPQITYVVPALDLSFVLAETCMH